MTIEASEARRKKHLLPRFSLRSLLIAVLLISVAAGWLAMRTRESARQRRVIAELQRDGVYLAGHGIDGKIVKTSNKGGLLALLDTGCIDRITFVRVERLEFSNWTMMNELTNLMSLQIALRQLRDAAEITGFTELKSLNVDGSAVQEMEVLDLAELEKLNAIEELQLNGIPIQDLTVLKELENLIRLEINGSRLHDLSPIRDLSKLTTLTIYRTHIQVADLSPLANMKSLQMIQFANTNVSDVSPLSGLVDLMRLDLSGTHVVDLSPLANMKGLQVIRIANTNVSDVSPLAGLVDLKHLDLSGTHVVDVSRLKQRLPNCAIKGL